MGSGSGKWEGRRDRIGTVNGKGCGKRNLMGTGRN
jgi:hypothetical protein